MRKVLLVFSVLCMLVFTVQAQNKPITGKVTDAANEPLVGVGVSLKGSTLGVTTDVNGSFRINVPSEGNPVLEFKYIGFKSREIVVGNQSSITVSLEEDAQLLGEVIVNVGYGTQKKKDVTGTVTSISGEELVKAPVSSAAEALTGRMPGVQVTTVDGAPGAEIVIRVRGGGSVTQDNSPLYIVDGFPVNSINDIAPSDIASIDILKDASSAAIYGARGANGVVIVTTKSAKSGKTSISYNGFAQLRTLPRELEVLSPFEYVLANYEYSAIRGGSDLTNFTKYYGQFDDLELYKNQKATNWQDKLFGKPVISQQQNLSITGGTDKTKLSFSVSNNLDQGIMINSDYKRTYLNFKLNHEIASSLKFDLSSRFSNTDVDGAGTSGGASVRIGDGITTRPVNGVADFIEIDPVTADASDDYDQFLRSIISPTELAVQDYRNRRERTFNMNTGVTWSIIKDLNFRSELGVDLGFGKQKRYFGPLTGESRNVGNNLPLGEITNSQSNKYRWANTLNYSFSPVKNHNLSVLLGQELVNGNGENQFTRNKFFAANLTPETLFSNMALGTMDRQSTFVNPEDNLASFFGRINYDFSRKYILTFTARADASSKFAPENRWGLFPAAAVAWRIGDEDFMDNLDFVSDLKLRVSLGAAGNNRIDNDMWRRTYKINDVRTIGFGNIAQPYWSTASSILVNPDLKWETTLTRNAGLDFALFNNKINGTLDVYHNTTKDLLVLSDIPSYLGYSTQMRNIGQTSNRGVELGLNGSIIEKKDFKLSANFNIGINKAKIDKLDGVDIKSYNSNWAGTDLKGQDDYRLIVGQTVGLMYGFESDGFYSVDDFDSYNTASRTYVLKPGVPTTGAYLGGLSVRPGTLKLKDLDGDGVITANGDRKIIGSALPKHTGGFGFNGSFKALDFSTFFNWVYGNDVYNSGKISFNMFYRTTYGNMLNTMNSDDRFKYINDAGQVITDLEELRTLNQDAKIWSPFSMGNASPVFHSYAVEDGSFLRLNNVTLGYSLPKSVISRFKMSRFRLYGTVYNAFVWSKYSGYDPEVSTTRSSGYSALTPGVDYSAYPKSRTFTIGANVTF